MAKNKHHIWPWNPQLMYCPKDDKYHSFGCDCARKDPDIIPACIRGWYRENWQESESKVVA